jgi:ribosome-associated toxin RatA of RatAB toxin-antitoxin module
VPSFSDEREDLTDKRRALACLVLSIGEGLATLIPVGRTSPQRLLSTIPALDLKKNERTSKMTRTHAPHMVAVKVEVIGAISRRLSGSINIDASAENVWAVLTDYDHAAAIVPSLIASRRLQTSDGSILVENESEAPPLPFLDRRQFTTFRVVERANAPIRTLESSLHSSKMFNDLRGKWIVKELTAGKTELSYTFEFELKKKQVLMKGPQLLLLTEAKLVNETPKNLEGVKKAAEGKIAGYKIPK